MTGPDQQSVSGGEGERSKTSADRPSAAGEGRASGGIFEGDGWLPSEVSVLRLINVLLEHRRAVVVLPLACAVLLLIYSFLSSPSFTSSATFMAQSEASSLSRLSGLATQIGVSVPSSLDGAEQSPAFYADLLRSSNLLREVVTTEFELPEGERGEGGTRKSELLQLLGVEGDSRPERIVNAVEALRNRMTTGTDLETGVVRVAVATPWPSVSHKVVERLIDLVNRFNVERRRSQAQAEREFLENRVASARRGLESAEDTLEEFLERNRRYENSPRLRFEYQSLQRRVELRQQVFTSLAQSLEQAKMQEVRSTPVITVVERPERPVKPDGQNRILLILLGVLLGGGLAVSWSFGHQFFQATRRTEPDAFARFEELRSEAEQELQQIWGRLLP